MIITKATYGEADCTNVIQSKVKDNRLILRADNNIIGDTKVGVVKYLEITGELAGEVFTERIREGDILTLPKSSNKRLGIFYSNNNNRALSSSKFSIFTEIALLGLVDVCEVLAHRGCVDHS